MSAASATLPSAPPAAASPAQPPGRGPLGLLAEHFDGQIGLQRRLRWPRAVVYLSALLVALALAWMQQAQVDRVVHTQGRVVPSGKQQLVQHLEGGIVSQVFVREGDKVSKGQNLIAVSDLQAASTLGEKRARLDGLAARIARLRAESEGATRFAPASGSVASPELRQQLDTFESRRARLAQSTRVIQQQIAQKQDEANEQQTRRRGLSAELDTARQQLAMVSQMVAKRAASQMELLDAQARVDRLQTQIKESDAALPRLASAVQELQARMAEVAAGFRSESQTALADAKVEHQRLSQEIGADADRMRRTVLTAPMSGVVNKLLFNTVGGVVRPGDTLMELTPDDDTLQVETRVSPADRGALKVGQSATLKIGAYDYTVFGTVQGRITEISPDTLADERGERWFRVAVAIDPASAQRFGQPIGPGMTVTADAVTGQRTVLQYLLSPIRGLATTALRDTK